MGEKLSVSANYAAQKKVVKQKFENQTTKPTAPKMEQGSVMCAYVKGFAKGVKEYFTEEYDMPENPTWYDKVAKDGHDGVKGWIDTVKDSDIGDICKGDFKSAAKKNWETLKNSDIGHYVRSEFKEGAKADVDAVKTLMDKNLTETALFIKPVKTAIKEGFKNIEAKVDDGDEKTLTPGEKVIESTKTIGKFADAVVSPQGAAVAGVTVKALKAAGGAISSTVGTTSASLAATGHTTASAVVASAPAAASAAAITGGAIVTADGTRRIIQADTKEEVQNGTTEAVIGASVAALGVAAAPKSVEIAKAAGVPLKDGNPIVQVFKAPVKAVTTPVSELKANALTHSTGVIQPGATVLKEGIHEAQANSPAREVYKFNPEAGSTPEEVLAKNPYVSYEAETGKYYVQTSWGEKSYIDPGKNYMIAKYGEGDYNAIEGAEFAKTYVEPEAYNATGAKNFIDPSKLEPGQQIMASKAEVARFKLMPKGTKYQSAEGPATLQKDSVLMIDKKGRPYQNTIEFLLQNNKGFTDKALKELLSTAKGIDGKPFLSSKSIQALLKNRRSLDDREIPNFEAKIKAVLNNPKEVEHITMFYKNRAYGVWRAIQEPLQSTEVANPKLFGLE